MCFWGIFFAPLKLFSGAIWQNLEAKSPSPPCNLRAVSHRTTSHHGSFLVWSHLTYLFLSHYPTHPPMFKFLLVGRVLRITTRSATGLPAIMVPFLCDPTWRTSSMVYKEIDNKISMLLDCYYSTISQHITARALKWTDFLEHKI